MINNIFNIFDPASRSLFSLNWLRIFIIFILAPYPFWIQPSRFSITWIIINKFIHKEFKTLINYSFSSLLILSSLFTTILINNFIGLFPYIFTAPRHIRFCLSMSLSIWIGIITYRITNYFNEICSHLTPQRTPFILIPFIVIIESISLIIRPITLAIRLTANIIAGHLLLSLLGSAGQLLLTSLIPILIGAQIILFILELSVSLIQAYVFSILSTLYIREI